MKTPMVKTFLRYRDREKFDKDLFESLDHISTEDFIDIKFSTCVDEANIYFSAIVIYSIEVDDED